MVMAASAAMTAVSFILGSALRVEWYCGNAMQMKETREEHCSSQTNVTYHPHLELSSSSSLSTNGSIVPCIIIANSPSSSPPLCDLPNSECTNHDASIDPGGW